MGSFQTLGQAVEVAGVGLHTGALVTLRLCPTDQVGYTFVRTDLPGRPQVAADVNLVATTQHATTLKLGEATVSTTEHLLAALWALDITHCRVEMDGPEVPILDGSAAPWCQALGRAGVRQLAGERPVWSLCGPVWVEADQATLLGVPHPEFRLSVAVDFGVAHAGPQAYDLCVNAGNFTRELAPARTFTLEAWIPKLRAAGLIKGGSEENAVVLWENGPAPVLRFPEEMARHKALDAIGDLALMLAPTGAIFRGHLLAVRAGHGPHRAWMQRCQSSGSLKIN